MKEQIFAVKEIYDWFKSVKNEARRSNGIYTINMTEQDYDALTEIFNMIATGKLQYMEEER